MFDGKQKDALANRNEIELPLYVYHDMDSCTAVSLKSRVLTEGLLLAWCQFYTWGM